MTKLFISYRRIDQDITGRIYDHLLHEFDGKDNVFKDVDNIPYGVDFHRVITEAVQNSDVLLVIVGKDWASTTDKDGQRRLDSPRDFVRIEIEAALEHKVPILPVRIHDATPPEPLELPPSLKAFGRLHMATVRPDPDFATDIERVCQSVRLLTGNDGGEKSEVDTSPALPGVLGELGPNPYRGLNAFDVQDAELFLDATLRLTACWTGCGN